MDVLGRVGFSIEGVVYKLCTIKVSRNDGSIYVGFSFGTDYRNQGISGQKITYHPDGNSWLTSDLQKNVVGRNFIRQASMAHMLGMSISETGKVHIKGEGYEQHPSFDEIEASGLIVKLKNGIELFEIHRSKNYGATYAVESNAKKLEMTNVLDARNYFSIKCRFFLVAKSAQKSFEETIKGRLGLSSFSYQHPSRRIGVFVIVKNTRG